MDLQIGQINATFGTLSRYENSTSSHSANSEAEHLDQTNASESPSPGKKAESSKLFHIRELMAYIEGRISSLVGGMQGITLSSLVNCLEKHIKTLQLDWSALLQKIEKGTNELMQKINVKKESHDYSGNTDPFNNQISDLKNSLVGSKKEVKAGKEESDSTLLKNRILEDSSPKNQEIEKLQENSPYLWHNNNKVNQSNNSIPNVKNPQANNRKVIQTGGAMGGSDISRLGTSSSKQYIAYNDPVNSSIRNNRYGENWKNIIGKHSSNHIVPMDPNKAKALREWFNQVA